MSPIRLPFSQVLPQMQGVMRRAAATNGEQDNMNMARASPFVHTMTTKLHKRLRCCCRYRGI